MKIPTKIESERLVIRRFISEDSDSFKRFMQNTEATRYLNFTDEQKSPAAIKNMFDGTLAGYDSENAHCILAIALAESNQFIGMVGGQPLETDGEFEIFYNLLPKFWGIGYATEAVKVFLDYLKDETPFEKAVAFIYIGNSASIKLAQRLNLTDEGEVMHEGKENYRYSYSLA